MSLNEAGKREFDFVEIDKWINNARKSLAENVNAKNRQIVVDKLGNEYKKQYLHFKELMKMYVPDDLEDFANKLNSKFNDLINDFPELKK